MATNALGQPLMSEEEAARLRAERGIPQTHCARCGREINGTEPRICVLCLTDAEKAEMQYGPGLEAAVGRRWD